MLRRIVVGTALAAGGWMAYQRAREWRATWGVDPDEADRPLPGDELIPEALSVDTRGITIDAPPEAVWPWLVQMGFGRAGWYSYDQLDMRGRSAEGIVPELQHLAVGEIMPTDSGGGFEVKVLDPGRSLVLFVDEALVAKRQPATVSMADGAPGLAASGKFMQTAMSPSFAASWAFVLEPAGTGRTRLIERVRVWFGAETTGSRLLGPTLGFGVFVMVQRQLRGIATRAERLARSGAAVPPLAPVALEVKPSTTNGHAPELAADAVPAV